MYFTLYLPVHSNLKLNTSPQQIIVWTFWTGRVWWYRDCESFARRTFTTPKIRTFTTPKFGHFPPPKKNICQEDNCHPQFFSSFFGALFLAFSTYSSWRTTRMGRRRCLTRWSWSTSSRRCVTRWSWSTSSRRWLSWWSWRTSRRRKGRLSFMFLFMAAWITHF